MTTLDKIRAEIEQTADEEQKYDKKWAMGLRYAVKIIDKVESDEVDFVQPHKKIPVTLDLTPCDDAVSRQEAIDAFQIFREYESNRSNKEWVDRIETVLNQLPPVKPKTELIHGLPDGCPIIPIRKRK